jgi:heme exporter protein D
LPDFPQVWSDQTLQAIAESGGAIMDMHGWNMAELFGRWGPYIALVAATAPPAMVTMVHLKKKRAYLAEMARRRAAGEGGPAPMPKAAAADGVTGDA